ncbi:unnamed protein product [Phyllotreta striolata]|uniref:Uncharacterized protein n=1 Tax=Phyllotreta striolata TaxID=444603 RepID=A0A9N9XM19_PHYSR|nr:unnamed protein product [Phyllotreta striolata]
MLQTFLVILLIGAATAVDLPSYIKPCSKTGNFSECALKHAKEAIPHMLKGDKKLQLPSFTPLMISAIDIKGANNFNVHLGNLKVYGLEFTEPVNISVDFAHRTAKVISTVPRLVVLGNYTINGKILIFTLNGHGAVNITLSKGTYEYGFHWTTEQRNGVEYGKIIGSNFDYAIEGVEYHFENVINKEKAISEQVNKILNKNWKIVNNDLKPSISETLLIIHNELFSKVFTQVPYKQLFLE